MPKDKNNNQAMTEDEKFRSFFSTTAVNIPEEMTRRDEEKPQKRFGLFARGKADQEEAQAAEPQEMPTGEVVLGGDAQPEQEADLELMLKPAADPERELAPWPLLETEAAQGGSPGPCSCKEAGAAQTERSPGGRACRAVQCGKNLPQSQECTGGASAAGGTGAAGNGSAQGHDQWPERNCS